MRKDSNQSEYGLPGAEFTLPSEQPETLSDKRRYPAAPAETVPETRLPADELGASLLRAPEEGDAQEGKKTAARRERKKRSLLLQFSAVAASVVLVTNSFGLDFLGLDGLFNDSVITGQISSSEETQPLPVDEPTKPSRTDKLYGDVLPVGGDRSFPQPEDREDREGEAAHNHYIAEAEFYEGSMGESAAAEGFVYVDPENSGLVTAPVPLTAGIPSENIVQKSSIRYDEATNTLILSDYRGKGLIVSRMGGDFTIRVEGDNYLEQYLLIAGGSVHLTGSGGLTINKDEEFDCGLFLAGDYSDACLMIEDEVNFRINGRVSAFGASATRAEKFVWFNLNYIWDDVMQGRLLQEDRQAGRLDSYHYYSWRMISDDRLAITGLSHGVDFWGSEETTPYESVPQTTDEIQPASEPTEPPQTETPSESEPAETFGLPIGGDTGFPILPNPQPNSSVPGYGVIDEDYIVLIDGTGERSVLYLNPLRAGVYEETVQPPGLSYDRNTNTLTMNNYHGGALEINMMGNSFRIELIGQNTLDNYIQIYGFYTGGSVTFAGSGSLAVNTDRVGIGLLLTGECSESCVMVEKDVTLDIYGDYAVYGERIRTDKLIYYKSDYELPGIYQLMFDDSAESDNPNVSGTFQLWSLLDQNGEIATRVWFSPDGTAPDRPEPVQPSGELPEGALPIGPDSEYPDLTVYTPSGGSYDERHIDLVFTDNEYQTISIYDADERENEKTVEGIRYDARTQTLYLTDYQGGGRIEADLRGVFTVHVEGMNELERFRLAVWSDLSSGPQNGCALLFEGSGTLRLNKDSSYARGLSVAANYSNSFIGVGRDVTLTVRGFETAFEVINTNAEKALYHLSASEVSGRVQAPEQDTPETNDWYVMDTSRSELAREVFFIPDAPAAALPEMPNGEQVNIPGSALVIGGDRSLPVPPDTDLSDTSQSRELYLRLDGQDYYLYDSRSDHPVSSFDGISFDPNTNTLTLHDYQGGGSMQAIHMGYLTVVAEGYNELDELYALGGRSAGAGLILKGSGTLILNKDGWVYNGLHVVLQGSGAEGYLAIDPALTLVVRGRQEAVVIVNSTSAKGIYYSSDTPAFGLLQTDLGRGNGNWYIVDFLNNCLATEVVFQPHNGWVPVTTSASADLSAFGQPAPVQQEMQRYGVSLGIRGLRQGSNQYLYSTDPNDKITHFNGVSYDPATNTLTLENYDGSSMELFGSYMGAFTIRLIGENRLGRISLSGVDDNVVSANSLLITGTGSLTLDPGNVGDYCISLMAASRTDPFSKGGVIIDRDATLELIGREGYSPLSVAYTSSACPLIHLGTTRSAAAVYTAHYYHNSAQYSDVPHMHNYLWELEDAETGEPLSHIVFAP